MHDLRQAIRQLRTRPSFSLVVILTLALGVGANTAMFSVVHGVLFCPLPFPESERLTTVWMTYPHWREREGLRELWDAIPLAYPEYLRLREEQPAMTPCRFIARIRWRSRTSIAPRSSPSAAPTTPCPACSALVP